MAAVVDFVQCTAASQDKRGRAAGGDVSDGRAAREGPVGAGEHGEQRGTARLADADGVTGADHRHAAAKIPVQRDGIGGAFRLHTYTSAPGGGCCVEDIATRAAIDGAGTGQRDRIIPGAGRDVRSAGLIDIGIGSSNAGAAAKDELTAVRCIGDDDLDVGAGDGLRPGQQIDDVVIAGRDREAATATPDKVEQVFIALDRWRHRGWIGRRSGDRDGRLVETTAHRGQQDRVRDDLRDKRIIAAAPRDGDRATRAR